KGAGLLANVPGRSPLPSPPYSRVNPLLHRGADRRGAGLPAKGPGLLASVPGRSATSYRPRGSGDSARLADDRCSTAYF
ncbi:hypothetical protein DBL03_09700, partial [Pseudomonas putida]